MPRAKPARATCSTWSSTAWRLTGASGGGRSSENTSIWSSRSRIRSVSAQIRRVNVAILRRQRRLDQLRRAADARQRILDLMRQHRGEAGHRAGRFAVGELAVQPLGGGPFEQHHEDGPRLVRHRHRLHVDDPLAAGSRRADMDGIFVDARVFLPNLRQKADQGRGKRHDIEETKALQHALAGGEKILRGAIGIGDGLAGIDDDAPDKAAPR